MAGPHAQNAQGAIVAKPPQPKDQPTGNAASVEGQPVFRDWAAI